MKPFKFIYLFFIFAMVFLNSCDGDNEPIDPALLIETPASCPELSFFNVSPFINGNTVRIDWDKTTADAWEVQYGPRGFTAGTGTTVNFTPTSSLISGLVSTTNYDFYIRSKCSDTEFSTWIGPVAPGSSIQVCVDPTGITATRMATDPTKATINWALTGTPNSWQVQYGAQGFVLGSGNILASSTVTKVISSLVPTTTYDVYVRANCSANQNSDWVGPITINAVGVITTCTTPVNLTAVRGAVTTEASVSWTPVGTEASWEIQYGSVGFAAGTGTSVTSTTPTKTITGLATTAYDFYVRAKCSATQNSAWVGPITMAAASSGGGYFLRMKVNGVMLNFPMITTMTTYMNTLFSITSISMTADKSFNLQISNPTGNGTYAYEFVDVECDYNENDSFFSSSYEDLTQSPGNITITDLNTTNNTIRGTFNFIGKDEEDMTLTRNITEGEFYLPYQ